jgi:hypothetical protein
MKTVNAINRVVKAACVVAVVVLASAVVGTPLSIVTLAPVVAVAVALTSDE